MGKYFIKRIVFMILLLIVTIAVYESFFHASILQKEGWLKAIGDRSFSIKADILYFSASPNASFSPNDSDQRSIDEMIQSFLPNYTIESLDTGAIHAGIFHHALQQMPKDYKPKIILMDLNLRSFGNMWIHSSLENSLQRNLAYWNQNLGLWNRTKVALKKYNYLPLNERNELIYYDEKFVNLPFKDSCKTVKRWIDSLMRRPEKQDGIGREMVRHFGFKIKEGNEMLSHYDEVVRYCKEKKLKLIFLLLPDNVEGMNLQAGEKLKTLCKLNADFLTNRYQSQNIEVINLNDLLGKEYYFENFPTEHYIASGRLKVAEEVVKKIKK